MLADARDGQEIKSATAAAVMMTNVIQPSTRCEGELPHLPITDGSLVSSTTNRTSGGATA
jgi:hypothetical protein